MFFGSRRAPNKAQKEFHGPAHVWLNVYVYSYRRPRVHRHARTHTCPDVHTLTYTPTQTHTYPNTHTPPSPLNVEKGVTSLRLDIDTYTLTRIHAHRHTRIHAYPYSKSFKFRSALHSSICAMTRFGRKWRNACVRKRSASCLLFVNPALHF